MLAYLLTIYYLIFFSTSQEEAHIMLIRTDYGHGKDLKHTNIDIYNKKKEKITDPEYSFIPQTFKIHNFEMALHYVFIQVEKHNPLVGPKYCLSPCQIHEERLMPTFEAWKESQIASTRLIQTLYIKSVNTRLIQHN